VRMRMLTAAVGAVLIAASTATAATIEVRGSAGSAIAAAILRAAPGDTVHLPAATFVLTEPIRPRSGIKLIGEGIEKSFVVYAGGKPASMIDIEGCENLEIAQLTLDGRKNPLIHQGISGSRSRRLWLHDLGIRNLADVKTWGPHAILFSGRSPTMEGGVTDSWISNCRIDNIGVGADFGGGIRLAWGCVRNQVLGNTITNTGRGGIFGDHSAELVIRNNRVSGSGGEGLGIEIWGGCPRSLIENNAVDHWISVDQGTQSAVRRNLVGYGDNTLKGYGIEIIARDVVVTDNVVKRGAQIGLSVSNKPVKENVFWGYNTVSDCIQWAAQLQGESGGIARHYFYRCNFEGTIRGDPQAVYRNDSGHGLRINGNCRQLVFDNCRFRGNGGYGLQLLGQGVGEISLLHCLISANGLAGVSGLSSYAAIELTDCKAAGNGNDTLPVSKPLPTPPPAADFRVPETIRAGEPAPFACASRAASGTIVQRLWDFNQGIPEVTANPKHTFDRPGKYRVTLIVWDSAGRGGHAEKMVEVLPGK
jgi:parallel beta-helix repeat protein